MTSSAPKHPPVHLAAGILSYLVPGLGQISQGRIGKGLLFMVCLLGLFHIGQRMGHGKNVYIPISEGPPLPEGRDQSLSEFRWQRLRKLPANIYQRWHFAGQFWIGVSAWPALWQYFELPVPMIDDPNHPDGRVPDPFWYNWQRCPSEAAINQLWVAGDKMLDLGWVYTVIAGVLNLLVIYDAYAGPAFREEPPGAPPKPTGDRSSQEATA